MEWLRTEDDKLFWFSVCLERVTWFESNIVRLINDFIDSYKAEGAAVNKKVPLLTKVPFMWFISKEGWTQEDRMLGFLSGATVRENINWIEAECNPLLYGLSESFIEGWLFATKFSSNPRSNYIKLGSSNRESLTMVKKNRPV